MATRDIYEREFDESIDKSVSADASCPECDGRVVTDGGETSCVACGLILEEHRLDLSAEKFSTPEDHHNRRRTGAPLTEGRHDRGLSSEIGRKRDANGNTLSSRKRRQLGRLRREHARARYGSKADRNLGAACGEIARIVSGLELPRTVRESASRTFRRAQEANLIVGRSIESMAAGSVYAAVREGQYVRSVQELVDVAKVGKQKLLNAYSVLNVELGLKASVPTPRSELPRIASECEVSSRVRHRAFEVAERAVETGIANGRNPSGVAAACLYLAASERELMVTQAEIAEAAGTSPVTLRKRYQELSAAVE